MTSSDLAIITDSLTKTYKNKPVVNRVSMSVPRGSVFGLLGPDGSGKTTFIAILLGLIKPTSGNFTLLGQTMNHRDVLRRTGAMLENQCFYPYMTGMQNLVYFQGVSCRSDRPDLEELLDRVGLADRAMDRFHTYTQGAKQRLGLACALLNGPEVVFLEDPTGGMDLGGRTEVLDLIQDLKSEGRTILMTSHSLSDIEQVCDNIAILSSGRLLVQGRIDNLVKSSTNEQVRVRTTDNAKAIEILSSLDWVGSITVEAGSLQVASHAERSKDITAVLSESSVFVSEMSVDQISLEQYYHKVTGSGGDAT